VKEDKETKKGNRKGVGIRENEGNTEREQRGTKIKASK
jgi:hypothetical protein